MYWWILPIFSMSTILSRIPQIAANFNAKQTGRLSVVTWFLQVAGSLGRLFTNLQEKGISESSDYISLDQLWLCYIKCSHIDANYFLLEKESKIK